MADDMIAVHTISGDQLISGDVETHNTDTTTSLHTVFLQQSEILYSI